MHHVSYDVYRSATPGMPTIANVASLIGDEKKRLPKALRPHVAELFTLRTVGRTVSLGLGWDGHWYLGFGQDASSWVERESRLVVRTLLYSDSNVRDVARGLVRSLGGASVHYDDHDHVAEYNEP